MGVPQGLKSKQCYQDPQFRVSSGPVVEPRGLGEIPMVAEGVKEGFLEAVSLKAC